MQLLEKLHFIGGLPPAEDFTNGTVQSDVFEVQGEGAAFLLWYGAAFGSTATLTIEACSNAAADATQAVAFYYKTSTTFDVWGDWAAAGVGGITVGAANSAKWIYVPAAELASEGYGYVRAVLTGGTSSDGVLAGFVVNPRFQEVPESQLD